MSKHLITGNELSSDDIKFLLSQSTEIKNNSFDNSAFLSGKHIAMIFEKPSLRTRFSFTVAVHQLGGHIVESIGKTRKDETPRDMIKVIQNYCDALVIRTYDYNLLLEMQEHAHIPIINALCDTFHPCQALADLLTLQEHFGMLDRLKIAYIGDGNNVLHSLMLSASKMGCKINYCCPKQYQPDQSVLSKISNLTSIQSFHHPEDAVANCDAVYTDVWSSMGFEERDETDFAGFQVNEMLMKKAKSNAVFMHCMPMERGKEVSKHLPDASCSLIYKQSENRLHTQKALLKYVMSK